MMPTICLAWAANSPFTTLALSLWTYRPLICVTGVIVSRQVLDVNFARGGVHNRCEVYKRIKQIIKKHKPARQRKQPEYLNEWEKTNLLQDLRDGDDELDLRKLKTIKTIPCGPSSTSPNRCWQRSCLDGWIVLHCS